MKKTFQQANSSLGDGFATTSVRVTIPVLRQFCSRVRRSYPFSFAVIVVIIILSAVLFADFTTAIAANTVGSDISAATGDVSNTYSGTVPDPSSSGKNNLRLNAFTTANVWISFNFYTGGYACTPQSVISATIVGINQCYPNYFTGGSGTYVMLTLRNSSSTQYQYRVTYYSNAACTAASIVNSTQYATVGSCTSAVVNNEPALYSVQWYSSFPVPTFNSTGYLRTAYGTSSGCSGQSGAIVGYLFWTTNDYCILNTNTATSSSALFCSSSVVTIQNYPQSDCVSGGFVTGSTYSKAQRCSTRAAVYQTSVPNLFGGSSLGVIVGGYFYYDCYGYPIIYSPTYRPVLPPLPAVPPAAATYSTSNVSSAGGDATAAVVLGVLGSLALLSILLYAYHKVMFWWLQSKELLHAQSRAESANALQLENARLHATSNSDGDSSFVRNTKLPNHASHGDHAYGGASSHQPVPVTMRDFILHQVGAFLSVETYKVHYFVLSAHPPDSTRTGIALVSTLRWFESNLNLNQSLALGEVQLKGCELSLRTTIGDKYDSKIHGECAVEVRVLAKSRVVISLLFDRPGDRLDSWVAAMNAHIAYSNQFQQL